MAAFFHGGSEAREAASSSDLTLQQHNLFLMNPLGHALFHAPPSDHLPLGVPTTVDMSTSTAHHNQYYNNLCFGSPMDPNPNPNPTREVNPGPGGSHGFELLLQQDPPSPLAVVSPGNCKKLSLSLSYRQPQSQSQVQRQTQMLMQKQTHVPYMTSDNTTTEHIEQGNSPVSTVTNSVFFGTTQSGHGGGLDPRYLKAAQELLDEIVSVGDAKKHDSIGSIGKLQVKREFSSGGSSGGGHKPTVGELTAANRQELQMKKAKLVSMVEEVELRYRHYHDQMQTIVSSFEQAAGSGAAKSYTSLALQTISKQFRCLKDAISSQIKLVSKCLGEELSGVGGKGEGCRSIRLVNQQLRHHLGIMQHHHANNAWRPQRGLPERAVSILRAWLFEHFLHPYPRDLDKQMLAKQTGLTRSQVSNWFINARVRLWKPMVEEMYMEEVKGQDNKKDDNINEENNDLELDGSSSKQPSSNASDPLPEKSNIYEKDNNNNNNNNASDQCSSSIISTNCLATASHGGIFNPHKKLRTFENDVVMQNSSSSIVAFGVERKQQADHAAGEAHLIQFNGEFGGYHHAMYGNRVSLSLGLPHSCDQSFNNIQYGTTHQIKFSGVSPSSTYQNIDIPNKKRFVANDAPLLPDFFT